jgi:hypothetical protein
MSDFGITVEIDAPIVVAKNIDGRVLFRLNIVSCSFSVFRSKRMSEEERAFITKFYSENIIGADVESMLKALSYQSDGDIYCA